ncbi:MAG: hypothetical protein VXZ82_10435 [Planctomycetota bacterium]|nr:hypothetical protein [Planctomycetota bacterium]
MAKWVRLWGKKRGARMSGWWVVGSVGEAAFFGILFLLGIVSLTIVVSWQVFWPESNIIRPGSGFWLMFSASLAFTVIGLTAFVLQVSQTLASPERRSALASKVKSEHQRRSDTANEHANLPDLGDMTDSPGVKLAYRLASQRGENSQLILSALFATAWNSVVAVMLVVDIFQLTSQARGSVFLTLLLLPFLTISVFATRWFFQLFRIRTGIGPTAVEISTLPLLPGHQYRLYICQYGKVDFTDFRIALVAFEETTFQQGTDVRTEVLEVSRIALELDQTPSEPKTDTELKEKSPENQGNLGGTGKDPGVPNEVVRERSLTESQDSNSDTIDDHSADSSVEPVAEDSNIKPNAKSPPKSQDRKNRRPRKRGRSKLKTRPSGPVRWSAEPEKPLELDCTVSLPVDMMHSFHSEHSALVWRIVIEGESTKWPAFCRSFPVAVYPRSAV